MKSLVLVFSLLFSFYSFADAWDNLTYAEAEAVVEELNRTPYIFDYCDCCEHSGEYATEVHFIRVIDAKIVTCEWNNEFYSVQVEVVPLAKMKYSAKGINSKKLVKPSITDGTKTIYMNYTWTMSSISTKATPYFNVVTYNFYGSDSKPCKKEFEYPTPKALKKVCNDADYTNWYLSKSSAQ